VNRITRKELKQDKFAAEVTHTVEYFNEHRRQTIRYGVIAVAAVLAIAGLFTYRSHEHAARQQALTAALDLYQTPVGAPAGDGGRTFQTPQQKTSASVKAFSEVAAKYSGSDEGISAQYYLAAIAADEGNMDGAIRNFKAVADSGDGNYASLAKLPLADLYKAQGKTAEGEALLRSLVDKPTDFVSKDQAAIALARYIAATKPAEARKLLEPLRTSRSVISRTALTELGTLPQQ